MKAFRIAMDILIFLLLVAVLAWCVFLFWGAYSQHRISILVNRNVLKEIQTGIVNQVKGAGISLTDEEIKRLKQVQVSLDPNVTNKGIQNLKEAQEDLFDTNTMSFLFQFTTLLLVTIGIAIIGLMYGLLRRTQEEAAQAQEKYTRITQQMTRFVKGRSSTIIMAVQLSRLHTFCQMYLLCGEKQRDELRVMMYDYHQDILRQLEAALKVGEGLEEAIFVGIALDAAIKNNFELKRIRDTVEGFEKDAIKRILDMSTQCLELLRENGTELVNRFNSQWKEIAGENIDS